MKKNIRLTESELYKIIKKIISEDSKMKIVNKSELDDIGNWDPHLLTHKKEGRSLYKIEKNKKLTKLENQYNPSSKNLIYLPDSVANRLNLMVDELNELTKRKEKLHNLIMNVLNSFH